MKIKQELITPERATALLATMESNRYMSRKKVEEYKRALKNGEFRLSTDPICLDESGHLINGQHRLTAVQESGISLLALVGYDVPKNTVFDKGLARSTGASLYMRGLIDKRLSTTHCLAFTNAFLRACGGRYAYLTDDQKGVFLNRFQNEILCTASFCRARAKNNVCGRAGVGAGVLAAMIYGIDPEALRHFTECVNTGFIMGDSESAAISLKNWLTETTGISGATIGDMQAAYTEQAIRDFMAGKPRHKRYTAINHIYIDPIVKRWSK